MKARETINRVLQALPSGAVRWAAQPVEERPKLSSGVSALDRILGGGFRRGKIGLLLGNCPYSTGVTSLAVATVAHTTSQGGLASWIDGDGSLDVASLSAQGADLLRVLWVKGPMEAQKVLGAAEEVARSNLFDCLVIRWPGGAFLPSSAWVRFARYLERSQCAAIVLSDSPIQGLFASLEARVKRFSGKFEGHVLREALCLIEGPLGTASVLLIPREAASFIEEDESSLVLESPIEEARYEVA